METIKTAVEFYREELNGLVSFRETKFKTEQEIFEQAKEMEKERLEDAYRTGIWDVGCRSTSFEEYYNRTFKQQEQ